jgi:hypothetical protein
VTPLGLPAGCSPMLGMDGDACRAVILAAPGSTRLFDRPHVSFQVIDTSSPSVKTCRQSTLPASLMLIAIHLFRIFYPLLIIPIPERHRRTHGTGECPSLIPVDLTVDPKTLCGRATLPLVTERN